jgi:hypothetical protein
LGILITDVEEALDKLIQETPSYVFPGEFTTDEAVERYRAEGDMASKWVIIKRLKALVDEGKLQRRKVNAGGKRIVLFSWIKQDEV